MTTETTTTARFANTAQTNPLVQTQRSNTGNGIQNPADGFLNLYLPGADGENRRKLGAIAVRKNVQREAQLIAACEKNPEAMGKWLAANLQVEYQAASENPGFDLPDFGETAEEDPTSAAAV